MSAFLTLLKLSNLLDSEHPLDAFVSNLRVTAINLRGGRPAWSTAVGLGPIPYRFAGSNPAPRISFSPQVRTMFTKWTKVASRCDHECVLLSLLNAPSPEKP